MSDDNEARNLREDLQRQIVEGQTAEIVASMARLLVQDILPAQDRIEAAQEHIKKQLVHLYGRTEFAHMAISEIHTMYGLLQDLMMVEHRGGAWDRFCEQRTQLTGRFERFLKRIEEGNGH